ncbi:MAG: bifunctional phosphoribosyl-AMP cyclohydrolase/phosphoribosyl-ATP diphosphatase HisIE [bacterium]|nr:bifunctional phosphoribosyl-AMP cyclohydrolase/phosphoribosyl-ATP diphosphatase HisIE [bacterium]
MERLTEKFKFDDKGLIPAIIQDVESDEVLMLAYMNKESLEKTIETGKTNFWSRSRDKFWLKGETSGHYQFVKEIYYDCDYDTLLIKVDQKGVACHTGERSCFYRSLSEGKLELPDSAKIIKELAEVIRERKVNPKNGSYTSHLLKEGQDKIIQKIIEEAGELLIEAKNKHQERIVSEMADLWYHCLVLLTYHDIELSDLFKELTNRRRNRKKGEKAEHQNNSNHKDEKSESANHPIWWE